MCSSVQPQRISISLNSILSLCIASVFNIPAPTTLRFYNGATVYLQLQVFLIEFYFTLWSSALDVLYAWSTIQSQRATS